MSNNSNFNSYSMPVLPYWPLESTVSVLGEALRFKSISFLKGDLSNLVNKPDPRLKDIEGVNILEAVVYLLRLLRFRSGAQFFRFNMRFDIKSNIAINNSDYENRFFKGYFGINDVNSKEDVNIPHWQRLIREQIDLQLLRTLNRFELVEFLYFNVIDVWFHACSSEEQNKEFGYNYTVRLEVFLAVRSIVGMDCSERFSQIISQPIAIPKNYSGAFFEFFPLNFEEANNCLRRLMCFVPKYLEGRIDRDKLHMIFHGWYCFRYAFVCPTWDLTMSIKDLVFLENSYNEAHKNFLKNFLYPYNLFFWWFTRLPGTHEINPYEPSLYSSVFEDSEIVPGKNHVHHKHANILGLSVASTYDSPSVLLNLIRSYCILKEIKLIDGQLFKLVNKSFLKPVGQLGWFKSNIFNIIEELTDDFPISIASMEIPLLISKQLNNVIDLIELNPDMIFKELDSFISDPVVSCFEVTNKEQHGSYFLDSDMYYKQQYS